MCSIASRVFPEFIQGVSINSELYIATERVPWDRFEQKISYKLGSSSHYRS